MRRSLVLLGSLLLVVVPRLGMAAPLEILFIGNSFTQYNEMPHMIRALARAAGSEAPGIDIGTAGGASLETLYDDPKGWPLNRISARKWSHVVVQEHSLHLVEQRETSFRYARQWIAKVRERGAKPIFFLPWARKGADQGKVNQAQMAIAQELGVVVAPVGAAFAHVARALPDLALYQADGIHPTPAASYLTALMLYASLYGKSPQGLPAKLMKQGTGEVLVDLSATPQVARKLQEIASMRAP